MTLKNISYIFRQDPWFSDIVKRLSSAVEAKNENECEKVKEFDPFENRYVLL